MQDWSNRGSSAVSWHEFDKSSRKYRLILSGVIIFLLACVSVSVVLLNQHIEQQAQARKPTVALVNEDQQASFNGKNYDFGQSFVSLVSNDNTYNWQVASRAVADKAYASGSVQAVIYLPQEFTHNVLTLQALNPQKAHVDYKVLSSQSPLTNSLLHNKINTILYDFNTSLVKMYYAYVAGNISSTQTNMASMVKNQGTTVSRLATAVYTPFEATNQSYGSVVSTANGLKSANESWINAQNGFTNSVTGMLNADSSSLNSELPQVTNYFDTQKQVTRINTANANQGIVSQATSDASHYGALYDTAFTHARAAMQRFEGTDADGNATGLYADLKGRISEYNGLIGATSDDIGARVSDLKTQQATLLNLEKDLYRQFFAQDVTPTADNTNFTSEQTPDNARTALASLVQTPFKRAGSLTEYSTGIAHLLANLSTDASDYNDLFTALVKNGSITAAQRHQYEGELAVLHEYATQLGVPTASSMNFGTIPSSDSTSQTVTKTLTVTVPAGMAYTVKPAATGAGISVGVDTASLPSGASASGNEVTLDNSGAAGSKTFAITYDVALGQAVSGTVTFTWGDDSDSYSSHDVFGLVPANSVSEYAGGGRFGYIAGILSNIDTAGSLVTFLYGQPHATYESMPGTSYTTCASGSQSMYCLYDNVSDGSIASRLNDGDVARFHDVGVQDVTNVTDTLDRLRDTIDGLEADEATLRDDLPADYFSSASQNLQKWYDATMAALNADYSSWTVNGTTLLQEKAWGEYQQGDNALYTDDADSNALYATLSQMMTSAARQAKDTASSAQLITSNSAEFTRMVDTVTQTQNDAQTVIGNTKNLLKDSTSDLNGSKNYYGSIASVLSNTRTSGVKANTIFSFLARPIATKDITPKTTASVHSVDWRWVLVFLMGLLLGVLSKTWIRRKPRKQDE